MLKSIYRAVCLLACLLTAFSCKKDNEQPQWPDPEQFGFDIKLHFRQEALLYDRSTSGSAWPFDEPRGTAAEVQTGKNWTVTGSAYPFTHTAESYYLNSKQGVKLVLSNASGYIETPAIDGAKLTKISLIAGQSGLRPKVTDCLGNIIPGGEEKGSCEACKDYVWDLTGSVEGEAVRFVLGASSANINALDFHFISSVQPEKSSLKAVYVSDTRNASFGQDKVGFSVSTVPVSAVSTGLEYRTAGSSDAFVPLSGSELELSDGVRYEYRAWAREKNSWKVYSSSSEVEKGSTVLFFEKNGAAYQPFTSDLPSSGTSLSGQARKFSEKDGGLEYSVFVPQGGELCLSSSDFLTVSSGGGASNAYIVLPTVPSKRLKSVQIAASSGIVGALKLSLCKKASASADSRLSLTATVSTSGKVELGNMAEDYTGPVYLVFEDAGKYCLKSISCTYGNAGKSGFVEEPDDTAQIPSGLFDYKTFAKLRHPRILLDSTAFSDLLKKVNNPSQSTKIVRSFHDKIISRAEKYLTGPLPEYKLDASSKRLLSQSRLAERYLSCFAYAYRMTGNVKYLTRAREVLNRVCSDFPDWHPSHFLDVAEMAFGVALAYDWLYYDLSLDERKLVHRRLVEYGMNQGLESAFHTTEGNWNQVCNAGMIAAALAVFEKDVNISFQTIEKGVTSNKAMMAEIYSPDGNYSEGYTYWDYGGFFQASIIQMLDKAFGSNAGLVDVDGFLKTAKYMLYMTSAQGPFAYSDGGSDAVTYQLAMWWFAAHQKDNSLLLQELRLLDDPMYEQIDYRPFPVVMSFVKDIEYNGETPVPPTESIWVGGGKTPVGMVRSGWKYDATDHYLAVKGGMANVSHGHMDAGSFTYDALGKRWSTDVTTHDYASLEVKVAAAGGSVTSRIQSSMRWDVFHLNNLCHSTLSVMDVLDEYVLFHKSDFRYNRMSEITQVIDNEHEKGFVINMSANYGHLSSSSRTIKLVDNRDLVVIDTVKAFSAMAAPVQWRMLTPAKVTIGQDKELLTIDDVTMELSTSTSVPVTYRNWDAKRPDNWQTADWDMDLSAYRIAGFEATVPAGNRVVFVTKLSPAK